MTFECTDADRLGEALKQVEIVRCQHRLPPEVRQDLDGVASRLRNTIRRLEPPYPAEDGEPGDGEETGVLAMYNYFDGALSLDNRSPDGFKRVRNVGAVLVNPHTGQVVLSGRAGHEHNCDQRGCGSIDHRIAEFHADTAVFSKEQKEEEDHAEDP